MPLKCVFKEVCAAESNRKSSEISKHGGLGLEADQAALSYKPV